jgi:predicted CXXCH cytochrome family protein
MRIVGWISYLVIAFLFAGVSATAGVSGSRHDFWLPGGGPPSSQGSGGACVFCHAPHTAAPALPLWNRHFSELSFTPYSSTSMQANPGQPTGSSKLCLSCHDGTIAVSEVVNSAVPVGLFGHARGRANLGTDLSDDHPVSFVFDGALAAEDGQIVHPDDLVGGAVRLDREGEMQCTSCHDAHSDRWGDFLVMDGKFSELCISCHQRLDWAGSAHNSSPATYRGGGLDPWPETDWTSVAANGCSNCHTSHSAGYPQTLLRFPLEEENCLVCHDGSLARKDVAADFRKLYRHPVDAYLGVHEPTEQFDNMPRHVECHDCHNPHAASDWRASAPDVAGALNGAPGASIAGTPLDRVRFQYEVCFRCHADGPGEPSPIIERQYAESNIRLKFEPGNPSYHPVADPGRNPDVPSLLSPWIPSSIIYCSDCHASDAGPAVDASGAAGPHGSKWRFLLERQYETEDLIPESENAYDLCYKCHDRNSILSDRSFPTHRLHIVDERTPCSICHDPHGVSRVQADPSSGTHLINFDVSVVTPATSGILRFEDTGNNHGSCSMTCHGIVHELKEY